MPFMYSGNVLVVDLSTGDVQELFLDEGLVEERVGGALLGLELWRRNRDGDPVVLSAGPLTGALVPTASSVALTARSPLTGGVVHASITNQAGPELKYAGYDLIVVRGDAPSPVYLWIHDEQADLVPADALWGTDAFAVTDAVRERQGDERVQVLAAGPACTAGSLASALTLNYWASTDRAAVGALFGRKRLLAIAARGMGELEPCDIEAVGPESLRLLDRVRAHIAEGTGPWDGGRLEAARQAIAPLVHRHRACFFCTSRGRPYLMLDDDPGRKEKSDLRAPGVLVSDLQPLGDLEAVGLDGPAIGRVTRETYRLGLDPARAARAVREAGARKETSVMAVLGRLARGEGAPPTGAPMVGWDLGDATGAHEAFSGLGIFTTANPPSEPVEGVDGAEGLVVQQGLAYILGLCPVGAQESGIDADAIEPVMEAATGLGLTAPDLEALARTLVKETLALQPTPSQESPATTGTLRGRFV